MTDMHTDYSTAVGRGFASIENRKEGWTDGVVATPHGFVTVYAQGDADQFHMTRLDFIFQGRLYTRSYRRRYTNRGIAMIAKRFAKETAND